MENLNHENIVRQIGYGTGVYTKKDGITKREVTYVILELVEVGTLFDLAIG